MKKLLLLLVPLLFLFGCNKSSYKEITYKKFNEMIENKESFVLFIGAESCSHCQTYKTTINEVIKEYDVTIHYVDIDTFSEKELSKLKNVASFTGTPTTVFIKDGEEKSSYDRIKGDRDFDYVVDKLKQSGYIKKVK